VGCKSELRGLPTFQPKNSTPPPYPFEKYIIQKKNEKKSAKIDKTVKKSLKIALRAVYTACVFGAKTQMDPFFRP
jgi:hypothetical protein